MKSSFNDPRFQRALNHVLRFEGGYVDHPQDPGGATKFGVTRKSLANWRGVKPWWRLPRSAVKQLGRVEVSKIYFEHYWLQSGADKMPGAIGFAVFDFAVNSGPLRAVKQLQRLLGVRPDGTIGPVTEMALRNFCREHGEEKLVRVYISSRHDFLKSLRTFKVFGKGWTNRIENVFAVAKTILKYTSHKETTEMNFLTGYKTYLVAFFMLISGALELLGVNVPTIEAGNAMQLVMEALAIIFLRKGLKTEIANA